VVVFVGEIKRADGDVRSAPEEILLTTSPQILQSLQTEIASRKDILSRENQYGGGGSGEDAGMAAKPRPRTAAGADGADSAAAAGAAGAAGAAEGGDDLDDLMGELDALSLPTSSDPFRREVSEAIVSEESAPDSSVSEASEHSAYKPPAGASVPRGRRLRIEFWSSWGNKHYVGLTGIEVLDKRGAKIALQPGDLTAGPMASLNEIEGYGGDDRVASNLLGNVCHSADDHHSWLTTLQPTTERRTFLEVDLGRETSVSAMRIWNFGAGMAGGEASLRGASWVSLSLDNAPLGAALLRKAPELLPSGRAGGVLGDYAQLLPLPLPPLKKLQWQRLQVMGGRSRIDQLVRPRGQLLRISILSTYGSPHYVGLNGLELTAVQRVPFSREGEGEQVVSVDLRGRLYCAPSCVNSLAGGAAVPQSQRDPRTADKLIDGENATWDDRHMWLAPFGCSNPPSETDVPNEIVILLDATLELHSLRIWNYSKTPARGVRELTVSLDDMLLCSAELLIAPAPPPHGASPAFEPQELLLGHGLEGYLGGKAPIGRILRQADRDGGVILYDEGRLCSSIAPDATPFSDSMRPGGAERPQTMARGRN